MEMIALNGISGHPATQHNDWTPFEDKKIQELRENPIYLASLYHSSIANVQTCSQNSDCLSQTDILTARLMEISLENIELLLLLTITSMAIMMILFSR